MFDEIELLETETELQGLLGHYGDLGKADRQVWQDRLMEMEGLSPRELASLHGELIAYCWLEQNTGITPGARSRTAAACYRITPAGVRALKELRAGIDVA